MTFITTGGMALRTPVETISVYGRATQGVQLMNLAEGDTIASVALLEEERRTARQQALEAQREALTQLLDTGDGQRPDARLDETDADEADDWDDYEEDTFDEPDSDFEGDDGGN